MNHDLDITWFPKQMVAWKALEREEYGTDGLPIGNNIGYGGALGGSKSHFVRNANIIRRFLYSGSTGMLFRRVRDDVYDTHVKYMIAEHPWIEEYFSEANDEFKFPNGSRIVIGYAQHTKDIYRYKSHEIDDLFIDQAEECEPEQLRFLKTRNRKSGKQSKQTMPKMFLAFNPGGPGHDYLKRVFVKRNNYAEGERAESYEFIQAYLWDNYQWVSDLPKKLHMTMEAYFTMEEQVRHDYALRYAQYANDLKALDPYARKAAIEGDWDSFAGQFFSKWNEEIHSIEPFTIPAHWKRLIAMDYGTQTAVIAGAVDEEGTIYLTHEYYSDDNSLGPRERAQSIAEWMIACGLAKNNTFFIGDDRNAMEKISWHVSFMSDINLWYPDSSNARRMPVQDFRDVGINPRKILGKQEDGRYRVICNEMMKSLFFWEQDANGEFVTKPRIRIFRGMLPEFCRTLPLLQVDPAKPLDFIQSKTNKKDHAYDAAKYLCMNISKQSGMLEIKKEVVSSQRRAGGRYALAPPTRLNYAR